MSSNIPLAEQLRPKNLSEFEGLEGLETGIVEQIQSGIGRLPSLILWGPPGSGKTTLAKLIGSSYDCRFVELSAVLSGVKEVRNVVDEARDYSVPTLLFVDEIHRFNKGQQDAFLPHVESGRIALIGATTENPSFYLTRALLSRCGVLVLPPLQERALRSVLLRAEHYVGVDVEDAGRDILCAQSGGDARRLLNSFENVLLAWRSARNEESPKHISRDFLDTHLQSVRLKPYDRDGEEHYNLTSAFIKSMRGSDADGALYYAFRMLEGGEDPRFLIRRLVIFASEDIGNADPRALQLAVSTLEAFQLVGLPEGRIPIAQCITYLATAPKSNRSYVAMQRALGAVSRFPNADVPLSLRNAETPLMSQLGYGRDYQYPHDVDGAFVRNERYLPPAVDGQPFYEPSNRGAERVISERLAWLRQQGK